MVYHRRDRRPLRRGARPRERRGNPQGQGRGSCRRRGSGQGANRGRKGCGRAGAQAMHRRPARRRRPQPPSCGSRPSKQREAEREEARRAREAAKPTMTDKIITSATRVGGELGRPPDRHPDPAQHPRRPVPGADDVAGRGIAGFAPRRRPPLPGRPLPLQPDGGGGGARAQGRRPLPLRARLWRGLENRPRALGPSTARPSGSPANRCPRSRASRSSATSRRPRANSSSISRIPASTGAARSRLVATRGRQVGFRGLGRREWQGRPHRQAADHRGRAVMPVYGTIGTDFPAAAATAAIACRSAFTATISARPHSTSSRWRGTVPTCC